MKSHHLVIATIALATLSVNSAIAADTLKTGEDMQREAQQHVADVDTAGLQTMLRQRPDLVLVDVRTPGEVKAMGGTIDAPNNIVIPRGWLEFRIGRYAQDPDTPIVVYCGANYRSPLAARTLQEMGYRNVKNYADGYIGWRQQGLPVRPTNR